MAETVPTTPDPEEEHVKELMETDGLEPALSQPGETVKPKADDLPPLDMFTDKELATAPELQALAESSTEISQAEEVVPSSADDATTDPAVDQAVDDITKHESDAVLEAADQAAGQVYVSKQGFGERFKAAIAGWWDNPRKRWGTIAGVLVVLIALAVIPVTRAFALNTVGVRSKVSVTVLDATTNLPLKNVAVTVAGQQAKTDIHGAATLDHVKLGSQQVHFQKLAFATTTEKVQVGIGTAKLGSVALRAIGTQFTFVLSDYVSGKPVAGAEVSSGESTAQSDKAGKAILTVQPNDGAKLTVQVQASGYRTEKQTIDATATKPAAVALVSAEKEVFISKQSGKYDVYTVDIDGQNRKVLLAGTGYENQSISLSVSPDGSQAALVSTRDNQHDSGGYLLSALNLIDVSSGAVTTLEHAEQISLLGWAGSKLVYTQTVAGASAANPNRQRIMSYDTAGNRRLQLASANYFNASLLINGNIYYAVSSSDPNATPSFTKISADNTGKQTIVNGEVWTVIRDSYGSLALQTPGGWLSYAIGGTATKPGTPPTNYSSRQYLDSPDGKQSLWVDSRDGKGVLLRHDVASGADTTIATQGGLVGAVRWLGNDTAVYRVDNSQETADYVISAQGGQPKKITDVTAAFQ